ncbi:molybdopterin molybdotransferase MoeA [soil metagenome]
MLTVRQALEQLLAGAAPLARAERVDTWDAAGRVATASITSPLDVPPVRNSQMDGYAVRSAELQSASAAAPLRLPVSQRIPASSVPQPLEAGTAARIFTGAMLPAGADAVVMQEQVTAVEGAALFRSGACAGEWVREAGEDIAAGAQIIDAGTRLSPQACGLIASVGIAQVDVAARPRVAIFFTGDELRMPGEALPAGAIYNSNRFILRGLLSRLGCEVGDFGLVRDDREATIEALRKASAAHDLVVTCGGVSVGEEDHVKAAAESIGSIDLWQIAVKPGKPLAFGRLGTGNVPFIGLPGNPVSAFVAFLIFVRPFILRLQGATALEPLRLRMVAGFDWSKPDKRQEYLRARIGSDGQLELYPSQASHVLTSTVWADGLVENPPGAAIERGDVVDFIPMSELLS